MKKLILAVLMTAAAPLAARAQYVKDFVEVDGARANKLRGYGIVTGLSGNGDSPRGETARVLRNLLQNLVPADAAVQQINARNAALVLVTSELLPFQKQGTRMDVTVSAVGDARSLFGGELQITDMRGPLGRRDKNIYALASGRVIVQGNDERGNVTTGSVPSGAIIEKALVHTFVRVRTDGRSSFTLLLKKPDLTTCSQLTQQINQTTLLSADEIPIKVAAAIDGGSLEVVVPTTEDFEKWTGVRPNVDYIREPVLWLERVLNRPVSFATVETARVIINDSTKTVSWTGEVQLREGSVMIPSAVQGARPMIVRSKDGQLLSEFMEGKNLILVNQQVVDVVRALHRAGLIKAEVRSE